MKILIFFFIASASGIHIDCHFSYDHDWHEIGQVYTCEVTSMDFSDNATHITGYSGTHLYGNSSADVKAFYFGTLCYQFDLKIVPKGFLNFFPNFNMLEFNTCSIETLNGDELDEYQNLERFAILNSNVERIPGILFTFTPNLKYIWFGFKIQRVGSGLIDYLSKLEQAYFWDNTCINQTALSSSEMPELIRGLKENCPDVDLTTITTISTTTDVERCEIDDVEEFVCGLDDEIENLRIKNENLETKIEDLKLIVEDLKNRLEILENIVK